MMRPESDNIHNLENDYTRLRRQQQSFDGGGGGGYDDLMEERVKKLEESGAKTAERLIAIERDLAVVRSNYATKEDLHKEISAQTWKLVTFVCGFGTALVAATYFIAKHATA